MGLLSQHFTGRTEELAQLRTMISCLRSSDQPGRCAIVGMPGLGKTQLALKTASEAFGQSKAVSILWVSAATSQRFIQGYSKILDLVDHIDRDHSDQSVKLASAQRWLECDNNSRSKLNKGDFPTTTTTDAELSWLLICDNVNDDTVPLLRENLPRCNKRGVIMITTRNMDVAKAFTYPGEQRQQIMSLDLPKREEAVELLCKELESLHSYKLHSKPAMDIDKAEELVLSLGRLPFAISQAASFANQSSKDLDYILRLCQGERKLQMLSWDNRFAIYEQRSIVAMFGTRLEDLNREEPLTSMLLKALALMDPESIPTDIWATGYSLAEPSNLDPRWVMRDFYDHKDTIGQNETETDGAETQQRFDHPKVTSSEGSSTGRYMVKLRTTLSRRKQSSSSKPQVVCKEVTALDSDLGRQIGHVEASLNRWNQPMWGLLNDPLEFPLAIQRLQKLALLHTVDHGKAVRMHDLVQLMVRQDMKRIGAENFCLNIAASTIQQSLFLSGNPEKPSSWLGYERLLPHLQSLIAFHQSMDCCSYRMVWAVRMMAKYLRFRGEPVECVEMLLKIVPQEEHHHGPNDQDLMRNLMELVLTYNHQGEWDSAEPLIRRVAICRKDLLGERHPLYINTLASMSIIKKAQKQYEEAESLIQEAIRGYRALPGERDRERSLPVQHNLGLLYAAQGRYEEAIQVYEKTLHEVEGLLDPGDHISVTLMANLADAQCKSGHQLQAQLTYERALKIMEEVWGVEHPETLRMMNDLGQVYEMQLRWEDAEALYVKLLEVQKKQWGEEHVKTLNAMGSLAHTYSGQGRYGDSMDLQHHVVKCMVDQFGLEDENTLRARCSLATYRRDVGSMKRRQHLRGDTIVP
jgi:tetratricopeptide (TPR) repeat protein